MSSPRACRALLALVLGACGALAWWGVTPSAAGADVCPGDVTCLVVRLVGPQGLMGSQTITIDQLSDSNGPYGTDLPAETAFKIRSARGQAAEPISGYTGGGQPYLSLRGLVEALGEQPGPFQGLSTGSISLVRISLPVKQGVDIVLSPPALDEAGANGFADGLLPAVIVERPDKLGFVRPLSGADDVNVGDYGFASSAAPNVITLSTSGRILTPTITTDTTSPTTDDTVTFGVELDDPPDGAVYEWDFGDGSPTATGATVTHRFERASSAGWKVRLEVSAPDGSGGSASRTVPVAPAVPDLEPRIVVDPVAPVVDDEVRFRVTGVPAGARYAWRIGESARTVSTGATLVHSFAREGEVVVRVDVAQGGRTGADAIVVAVGAAGVPPGPGGPTGEPTNPPTTESTAGPTEGPSSPPDDGGLSSDPDAPLIGPDSGSGTSAGGTPDPTPTPPGGSRPTGGLTGILLTGLATPVEVVPEAPGDQQAAAGARARDLSAAGSGTTSGGVPWAFGLVPLLLGIGIAREAGWVSRLRTSSARA